MSVRRITVLSATLVLLTAAAAVAAWPPTGEGGVLKFSEASYNVHEDVGIAVIAVDRIEGTAGAATVDFETLDGTAEAGTDYTSVSGTLSWADGEGGSKTFDVPIIDDADPELLETVHLVLSAPTGEAALHPWRDQSTLRIVPSDLADDDDEENDEDGSVLKLERRRHEVGESDGAVMVTVERRGDDTGVVTVDYATSDGSALAGEDYGAAADTLTWDDGDSADKTFMIDIIDDDVEEGLERFHVVLSNPTGDARLVPGLSRATVGIIDDETGACEPSDTVLCLVENRFRVEASWTTPDGVSGEAHFEPVSNNAGLVWFFQESNVEGVVKMMDGCRVEGLESFWLFVSMTTTLEVELTVTDTQSGDVEVYVSAPGSAMEPIVDVSSFTSCS